MAKLTSRASADAREERHPDQRPGGVAQVEEDRADQGRRQPAADQVEGRATDVGGEVPAEDPDRPVEVERHVAGLDAGGQVGGGAAAPHARRS